MLLLATNVFACGLPELQQHVHDADRAIEELDTDALTLATDAMAASLLCQERPLPLADAAHLHRVRGIQAFVSGETEAADLWFAASRALDPAAPLGHGIGGPIQAAWDRAWSVDPPERTQLTRPRRGTLFIDGQALTSHPTYLPWVFQHVDGSQIQTALVGAGAAHPSYPGDRPPPTGDEKPRRGKPLTLVALGCGGLAAAGLGGAAWTRARYRDPNLNDIQADSLIPTNRALGIAGFSFAGLAVGLGTVAAISGEW